MRPARLPVLLLACTAVLTMAGFWLKAQCIGHYDALRDSNLCSNDIQVLYQWRDMVHHPFPYVNGDLVNHQLVGGALEYPVLTGLFAWYPALFVSNDGDYLRLTALFLLPFTFATVVLLHRMVGNRAYLYALAPPLVWYSFHNWDLLVVCAVVAACYAWWRERWGWAGALVAVGASLKFWPVLFVLPLLLDRLAAGDRRGAVRGVGAFALVSAAVNVPFVLASARGWWAPFAFQKERAADITANSIWYWGLPDLSTDDLNRLIPVLLVVGTLLACGVGWWRARGEGAYPFVQVCGALLVLFMLTNKAHSPQYALWLLPFFCLVRLRWGWFAAYMVADALMYVGVFRWYYDLHRGLDFTLAKQALVLGVWGRAALLVLLFVVLLRADSALEERATSAPEGPGSRARSLPAAAPVPSA
jgi:uncharacterized membrane protein